ncbi:MAG: hypothetical protein WKG07_02280 [Hymenobacter sp.]
MRPLPRLHGSLDVYYLGLNKHNARCRAGLQLRAAPQVGARFWATRPRLALRPGSEAGGWGASAVAAFGPTTCPACCATSWRALAPGAHAALRHQRHQWRPGTPATPVCKPLTRFVAKPAFWAGQHAHRAGQSARPAPRCGAAFQPQHEAAGGCGLALAAKRAGRGLRAEPATHYSRRLPGRAALPTRRYLGRQLTADWNWQASRHLVLEFTYAWMPAGPYLRATTPGRPLSYHKPALLFQF